MSKPVNWLDQNFKTKERLNYCTKTGQTKYGFSVSSGFDFLEKNNLFSQSVAFAQKS